MGIPSYFSCQNCKPYLYLFLPSFLLLTKATPSLLWIPSLSTRQKLYTVRYAFPLLYDHLFHLSWLCHGFEACWSFPSQKRKKESPMTPHSPSVPSYCPIPYPFRQANFKELPYSIPLLFVSHSSASLASLFISAKTKTGNETFPGLVLLSLSAAFETAAPISSTNTVCPWLPWPPLSLLFSCCHSGSPSSPRLLHIGDPQSSASVPILFSVAPLHLAQGTDSHAQLGKFQLCALDCHLSPTWPFLS